VSVAVLVDNALRCVRAARGAGVEPGVLLISPDALRSLHEVKAAEQRRGLPLLLLGKRVRADGGVVGDDVTTSVSDLMDGNPR
jgi:hypothetical protein